MKSTGMTRKVDGLGLVVIPKELRDTFGIKEQSPLEIFIEGRKNCFTEVSSWWGLCGNR